MGKAGRPRRIVAKPYARPGGANPGRRRLSSFVGHGLCRLRRDFALARPSVRMRRLAVGEEFSGVKVLHFFSRRWREACDLIRIERHRTLCELRKRCESYCGFRERGYQKHTANEDWPIALFQTLDEEDQ